MIMRTGLGVMTVFLLLAAVAQVKFMNKISMVMIDGDVLISEVNIIFPAAQRPGPIHMDGECT